MGLLTSKTIIPNSFALASQAKFHNWSLRISLQPCSRHLRSHVSSALFLPGLSGAMGYDKRGTRLLLPCLWRLFPPLTLHITQPQEAPWFFQIWGEYFHLHRGAKFQLQCNRSYCNTGQVSHTTGSKLLLLLPLHRGLSPALLLVRAVSGLKLLAWLKALEKCSSTTEPMSPWK